MYYFTDNMDILRLNKMKFHAYHGCLAQEHVVGNDYEIDLGIKIDLKKACLSDNLNDTVNYALIYDEVKIIMNKRLQLIEFVAESIAQALKLKFPQIAEVEVRVRKMHPPIQGEIESAEIIIVR